MEFTIARAVALFASLGLAGCPRSRGSNDAPAPLQAATADEKSVSPPTGPTVLRGRLTHAGAPVEGEIVYLKTVNDVPGRALGTFVSLTDAEGRFTIQGVPAGMAILVADEREFEIIVSALPSPPDKIIVLP